MRFALYTVASAALAAATILSAYLQHRTFYTTCLYLSRSSGSMMLLMNVVFLITILSGKLLQKLFFGPLRAVEVEHLYERSWFAVTETCLAMTIFRDEFDMRFIAVFTLLLFLKIFHWLAQDRVEYMEQSPVLPRLFHLRMVSVMSILFSMDVLLIAHAVNVSLARGPSMMFMFGFEYTILASSIVATAAKYTLHSIDMRTEEPWENKSMYVFYLELTFDFVKLVTYLIFFSLILTFYGLPLHIVRDVYLTLRSFMQKCRDLVRYQRATRNMNERYPDATEEELSRMTDRTCIICREEMGSAVLGGEGSSERNAGAGGGVPGTPPGVRRGSTGAQEGARPPHAETPKKLPCGHVFHFHCLRSWLERQQTCPTCRRTVLQDDPPAARQPTRPANIPPENPAGQNRLPLRPEHIAPAGGPRGGAPPGYAGFHPAMLYPTRPTNLLVPPQPQPQPTGVNMGDNPAPTALPSASGTPATHLPTAPSAETSASVHPPLYPHPGHQPHLIPLFPIPQPREIQRPRSGSRTPPQSSTFTSNFQPPAPPLSTTSTSTPVPQPIPGIGDFPAIPVLSEEQILRLGDTTQQGLLERYRMLQTLDAHLWELITIIGRAISVVQEPTMRNPTSSASPPAPPPSVPPSSSSFETCSTIRPRKRPASAESEPDAVRDFETASFSSSISHPHSQPPPPLSNSGPYTVPLSSSNGDDVPDGAREGQVDGKGKGREKS